MTTNEPAFPHHIIGQNSLGYATEDFVNGLSKREWFAGLAMQGRMSYNGKNGNAQQLAKEAYEIADAMIEQSKI